MEELENLYEQLLLNINGMNRINRFGDILVLMSYLEAIEKLCRIFLEHLDKLEKNDRVRVLSYLKSNIGREKHLEEIIKRVFNGNEYIKNDK